MQHTNEIVNSISHTHDGTKLQKMRGRIKSLKKMYGFIGGRDSVDYFFHWTYLTDNTKTFNQLKVGDTVEFIPEKADDKDRAREVVAID